MKDYKEIRDEGAAFDAWISAIPFNVYNPCPCGCGQKYRYVEKSPEIEAEHYLRFKTNFLKPIPSAN